MNELVNGVAEVKVVPNERTCQKTPGCPRRDGHNGICKGQRLKVRRLSTDSPEEQKAANAERMRLARAQNKSYGRGPKATTAAAVTSTTARGEQSAARISRKTQAASLLTAAEIDPGYFKIEFEDGEDTISREGHGREGFARALKALYQEFAGGVNG